MTIVSSQIIIGLEVHVELSTRTKMFSRAPSPAHRAHHEAAPNTLTDATVLALPGALPVPNAHALELAIRVGLALNCRIAEVTRWDRKSYFYPDMPKAYQISQFDLPICAEGFAHVASDDPHAPPLRVGIIRAHLEEDAGKLLHEAPGGAKIDFSIVDYNRAGTPLLEIVTEPDFRTPDQVVRFAKDLRTICRSLGVTEGVMQKGHMRFEPNINCVLTLEGGKAARTPIVEIKNLNSFKSLRDAIEHEAAEQPRRWLQDRRELGPGTKTTRGWDDARGVTVLQREKEDAHDYRYLPDPDLPPVRVDIAWVRHIQDSLPPLPAARAAAYTRDWDIPAADAAAIAAERSAADLLDAAVGALAQLGVPPARGARAASNIIVQVLLPRATEDGPPATSPLWLAAVVKLRDEGSLSHQGVAPLLGLADGAGAHAAPPAGESPEVALQRATAAARAAGLLVVRDDAALQQWARSVIEANPKVAADVRAGKVAAAGRLVGEVMKLSGGSADAKSVREVILRLLGAG
ncbi:MAG: Asp-tRNA(Asn)/Glu-tRNA(Gln) amidotransferase subunit GatB [Phycisphaerales bacterium]|nr:Asp-tRNA(Asn)/Glu-tRNA(Gln) amidotransferase subunit GatB [Phycisphaerales bacterium]